MKLLTLLSLCATALQAQGQRVTVTVDPHDTLGSFDSRSALGSTIDGHVAGATRYIFTRKNVAAMKTANFHSISYRIRTELGIEAWHWNPRGRWSDATHKQGYWTSDDALGAPIRASYGYRLPRRGNTIDQANDDGYSRLTDGDTTSFWKSNPYLDSRYTGEAPDSHPQWVIVDMDSAVDMNSVTIHWGTPYATRYEIQYWPDEQPNGPDDDTKDGGWRTFDTGSITGGPLAAGGTAVVQLSVRPTHTRWIRILMHTSSHRGPPGSRDWRDAAGFAIREISIERSVNGLLRTISEGAPHAAEQTRTYASSTDPWHRETDRDHDTEQPGIDLVFSSGLTRGLPMLTPVGVLYDTPANAAALLRYVRRRHYAVPRIELGEEPDGQFVSPDDFAALYIQVADSLRAVDPTVITGGPSLQDARTKVMMSWKEGTTDTRSWLAHFIDALKARNHMRDLAFVSFEFYPFDQACMATAPQIAQVPRKLRKSVEQFRSDGVPVNVPLLMTEYGYSAFSTSAEMDRAGAILNAESVTQFLTLGGAEAFYYGTEPSGLDKNGNCDSWGDNTLFLANDQREIRAKTSTYHAGRMVTTLWADSAGGRHTILGTNVTGISGNASVIGAYSLRRPDGRIAVLIVNRDPDNAWTVDLNELDRNALDVWRFSAAEYEWHANGLNGFAKPNTGARKIPHARGESVQLPPYSIVVIRER